jgi:hypothetical protein
MDRIGLKLRAATSGIILGKIRGDGGGSRKREHENTKLCSLAS